MEADIADIVGNVALFNSPLNKLSRGQCKKEKASLFGGSICKSLRIATAAMHRYFSVSLAIFHSVSLNAKSKP